MTIARRSLPLLRVSLLLAALLPGFCFGQSTSPQPTPAAAAAQTAQSQNQQAYTLPPDKLAKAIELSRIRHTLTIVSALWGLLAMWILLATRVYSRIAGWAERTLKQRWLSGLLFFAIYMVVDSLLDLPLSLYGQHVERVYGISVQTWGSWFGDLGKAFGLGLVFGTPILLLFNWIVKKWPSRFWLGLWAVTVPILVLIMFVAPLIAPLFNKYEPLGKSHAALVADLEKLVARTGTNIPPERMFLMKASEKSTGLNASVSGIGSTKRVVVWDNTAGRIPNDEILFIFGHESGHYVLNHIPKQLAAMVVILFFLYWGCAAFAGWMVRRFGPSWGADGLASRTGFLVLMFSISLVSFFLTPIDAAMSRHYEHEADIYGQEAIHGLVADPQKTAVNAFNDLGKAWLEDPNPSPFIEFWMYSHPSVQSRANFALHYDPWSNGGHGRFFAK